jgi:BirA family biotin operon repressor/biotin-[acetyl-CoA-carboxylase] ligase
METCSRNRPVVVCGHCKELPEEVAVVMGNGLSPASITTNLETHFIGQRVVHYPSLPSTMDVARQEAVRGAAEGTIVIADEQTAGKGRLKRLWLSPRGNIALSIILYPRLIYLPSLIIFASLAVVHSIEAVTGLKSVIKWPNDVLINGRKVCGILIESEVKGGRVDYAVIGIGINVNLRPSDFSETTPWATSLSDELGREVSCMDIARRLLIEVERLYLALSSEESVYEEWRDRLVTLGKKVRVSWARTRYEGIAEAVDKDGSLLLRRRDGSLSRVVAGDVTLRDCT